jgi:hypothetical protein
MARPRKNIDQKQFESLCGLQCTQEEMCCFFNVDDVTLNRWCKRTYKKSFSEVFKSKRGTGKISLRRNQWKLAETNVAMAIFLGKQYLGQSDNPVVDQETTADDGFLKALEGKAAEDWAEDVEE